MELVYNKVTRSILSGYVYQTTLIHVSVATVFVT
jgi:hypothetical protein